LDYNIKEGQGYPLPLRLRIELLNLFVKRVLPTYLKDFLLDLLNNGIIVNVVGLKSIEIIFASRILKM
jgi:hypothetical protein